MKKYVIKYENGAYRCGEFKSYQDAINYAENNNGGWNFTIEEYENEDDLMKKVIVNVINLAGTEICYEAAVMYMDDDIREQLNFELAPCTEQEFFTAYEKAHEEKYGEEWWLSKANPVW